MRRLPLAALCLTSTACFLNPAAPSAPLAPAPASVASPAPVFDPVGVLVTDGNSLTQSRNGVIAMPDALADALGHPSHLTFVSAGESGHTTPEMIVTARRLVDPLYQAGQLNIVLAWEGSNDLYFGATADETVDHLRTYALDRRAAGFQVVLLTVLPRSGVLRAGWEADRVSVNARLRAEAPGWVTALVDVASDPLMGDPSATTQGVYYSPIDLVHLTEPGSRRIAALVAPVMRGLLAGSR